MALLSDFEGRAIKIAVATPGEVDATQAETLLTRQLGNLPRLLHPDCQIFWIHGCTNGPITPFKIDGRAIVPVPMPHDQPLAGHMRWIQDPFVCLRTDDTTTLVLPRDAAPVAKEMVLRLASALQCTVKPVDFWLEGGNMLTIGDMLLLGKDMAAQNGIPQKENWLLPARDQWETLEGTLATCFGSMQIVWVGTKLRLHVTVTSAAVKKEGWQPFFHLDLFILPAGYNVHGHLRLFIGEICNWDHLGLTDRHIADLERLQRSLEEVVDHLLGALPPIEIARLPILATFTAGQLFVESLCNGWVEHTAQEHIAYLPDFGLNDRRDAYAQHRHAMHLSAERVLSKWGIKPIWINMNFDDLASDGGALHCAVKILERTL
jgi:hypothetical protein